MPEWALTMVTGSSGSSVSKLARREGALLDGRSECRPECRSEERRRSSSFGCDDNGDNGGCCCCGDCG